MIEDDLHRKLEDTRATATRANGIARAALITAVMALAVGVPGLRLPINVR